MFGMISVTAKDLMSGYTVILTQLYTKRYRRNMYLIWELQLIHQLYLCKITLNVPQRSIKTFSSEEDVIVIKWPAQNLDMNPIENAWKLLN